MALDRFKTQVLLLHSEQSTLDSLSSGFSDRYTVHCATSGSEALNTLVATPINVIITAQDLPGMSGLEALREAKKRSPDTIGILLAGNSDRDLEALVGDEEVFQVVRGNVTSGSLLKLVENATRQIRLMALAGAANDTAANVDQPAEHIVMETSENGATIISDGTGRMPVLNPEKISAAVSVGSKSVDVLVLTKDQEFLTTIKESSRGMHTVHYANTLAQADETIREQEIGVAVVDAAMVGQKVEQLTQHLRKGSARLVSIVAGRRDDGEMLMDLINRGKVYRFLLKPVSPGRARLAVEASVKHHLEAPDAAFKIKGGPAAAVPAPKPAPKPSAKPEPKPAPTAKARPAPAPKPAPEKTRQRAEKPTPAPKPVPVYPPLGDLNIESPINEGLASAFGEDDSSFTETMTGIVSSVTEKFKGKKESAPVAPEVPTAELAPSAPTGGSGGSLLKSPKVLGIAAAAVAVIAIGSVWFMSGKEDAVPVEPATTGSPSFTEADAVFDAPPRPGANAGALIDEARLARDAGQVFNPAGSNAIELYTAAVAADPSNVIVAAEFESIIQQALTMAETALLEARLDDADAALQRVAVADTDNTRLPFLKAQLSQMQLRGYVTDARSAILDERFEDAANALAAANALGVADAVEELDVLAHELSSARIDQRVDEVLALANARLEEGDLLRPANNNARYYYNLVLSNDPANTAARQGLNVVASRLVLQARTYIDAGNLDSAEALLAEARAIDASNIELVATDASLANARDATVAAEQRRAADARRQAEADRLAEQERLAAEVRVEQERLDAEARVEQERLDAEAGIEQERLDAEASVEQERLDAAQALAVPAVIATEDTPAETIEEPVADIDEEPVAAVETPEPTVVAAREQTTVTISSLTRTRYVAPKYPRTAQRRGQSGWVDVVFTVAADGTVKDLRVRKSDPEGVFENSAMRAVEKWEFEPVVKDGVIVEQSAGVRMMFALE